MKIYMADEVGQEVTEVDVPDVYWTSTLHMNEMYDNHDCDIFLIGLIEGWMQGHGDTSLDDEEYPNPRMILRVDNVIRCIGRFGRDKRYVIAVSTDLEDMASAKRVVENWLAEEKDDDTKTSDTK